jgi:hypothetical protein
MMIAPGMMRMCAPCASNQRPTTRPPKKSRNCCTPPIQAIVSGEVVDRIVVS